MTILKVKGISKQDERGYTLRDISFSQQKQQKIALAGETGSGKSSLLKVIAGLAQASAGEVLFEDQKVKGPEEKLVAGHAGIAYLSQQYELAGFLRVEQVLSYANTLPAAKAAKLYEICQISHLLKRKTDQLSGGERQRIALARLLVSAPKLLLLDEPFSNLDMVHKSLLKRVIHDIGEALDITCILVSHDPADTLSWADEIIVMKAGELQQQGSPELIYRKPVNEYVAGLFGRYNILSPAAASTLNLLAKTSPKGKRILIRPEFLKIAKEGSNSMLGEVKKVDFFGSYYALEVLCSKTLLSIETTAAHVKEGDQLYFSLAPEDVCYM